jgi:ATP-binding cassette subfamily F protein 3
MSTSLNIDLNIRCAGGRPWRGGRAMQYSGAAMSLLQVQGLAKFHGGRAVFRDVGFALARGERAGLVGPNGAGKTTLLEILAGRAEPDHGTVALARGVEVGYLPQDPDLPQGRLRAVALAARPDFAAAARRMAALEAELAAGRDVLAEYAEAQHAFEHAGGYDWEHRVDEVLGGLGFGPADHGTDLARLSGGQRLRAALARLLLRQPDLLLLDEPTNHLDAGAVAWLEGWLPRFPGTVLVVSHDRYFLDRVCSHVFELDGGHLTAYRGNYSAYVRQRAERLAAEEQAAERLEAEREKLRAYVERYRAGNRARQARSRERRLQRLEEEPGQRTVAPQAAPMRLHFRPRGGSPREVLALEGVAKRFGERELIAPFSAEVLRGERVGVVGPNGAGKTTLLRVLAGEEEPSAGEVWWGAGTRVGFFRQDLGGLDDDQTVLEAVLDADADLTPGSARDLLARFLFRGDAVFTRVGDLSGGERNRLSLCRLMLAGDNVLLLDEPTNHLDIPAREALEAALLAFPGTLIVASHDRYLLDRVATRIWALEGGRVADIPGGYAAYAARLAAAAATPPPPAPARPGRSSPPRLPRPTRPAVDMEALEAAITRLEADVATLEERLADPGLYRSGNAPAAVAAYDAAKTELARLYAEWEAGVATLEAKEPGGRRERHA